MMYRSLGLHHIFTGPGSIRLFLVEFIVALLGCALFWAFLVIAPGLEQAVIEMKVRNDGL